ncbi:hypothetical protein BSN85_16295 [Bradyrhizobium brasilense]|uniref:MobA/MobL family protein n=1 Tax=Bradyrhizobium brasilense TaxID=1419277 RepID=UPI00097711E6|nr:MobA/MobL family protein [Bradyrhizobium brasilense]OMI09488.1 hypothetical protein BSN85_16295 [Bradyrhizobium brasilense]
MAIFSLHHSFIGRSTHAAGSASLFARYATGQDRCTEVISERMPDERSSLMKWLDTQEQGDRKNARVIDKVVVALPLELDRDENLNFVRDFCERMTEGRASWAAAIHDGPKDHDNPHAHIIFRDRDPETGKRVMLTTERGSTERFREGWEQEANIALHRAGHDVRIDRRSLADQGIDREAEIHVGAGAKRLAEKSHEFQSTQKEVTRIIDGKRETVTVNYPAIDQGSTRYEENEARKMRNQERTAYEQAMGPVGLPDGLPFFPLDRQTVMDSIHKNELRLTHLYQMIALDDAEAVSGTSDALLETAMEHFREHGDDGLFRERISQEHGSHERGGPSNQSEKSPRRDGFDLFGGGGLKVLGKISESLETLFDGPAGRKRHHGEQDMVDDRKATTSRQVEQQQRQQEAEQAKARKAEMEAYLEERAQARGIDRGRGR